MKTTKILIFVFAGLLLSGNVSAQTLVMVNWKCMLPDSQNVSAEAGHFIQTKKMVLLK